MEDIFVNDDSMHPCSHRVKINVGGKSFEVSRSLIHQYPESMIGRLISDTWHKSHHEDAIFIDRDGDIFNHVLNYMRYGSIELPAVVPKAMFQRELDFYGLEITGSIKEESSIETLKEWKSCIEQAELHHDMLLIATHCYHEFMMSKKEVRIESNSNVERQLKHSPFHYHYGDAMRVLNYYLRKYYGLKASAPQTSIYSTDFLLEVKQMNEGDGDDRKQSSFKTGQDGYSNAMTLCDETVSISASDLMTH
jgi:hypothetical protein